MSSKDICLAKFKELNGARVDAEHVIWLKSNLIKVAVRFIFSLPEYTELRKELNDILQNGAKSRSEAVYLFTIGKIEPLRCACGKFRSFSIGGKDNYPKVLCPSCANKQAVLNGIATKNKIGEDGLTSHSRAAFKASKTKKATIHENGLNTIQQIQAKCADKKAMAMSRFMAELQAKCSTNDMSDAALYVVFDPAIDAYKIGRSKDPGRRVCDMMKQIKRPLSLAYIGQGKLCDIAKIELQLHEYFEEDNVLQPKGFPGRTEWFSSKIKDELALILEDLTLTTLFFKGKFYGTSIS
jgi:hypothetical protein